jgi:hypothetical protein
VSTDFTLEPDEPDLDRPERAPPVWMVATGLAPTSALPAKATKGTDAPRPTDALGRGSMPNIYWMQEKESEQV